MATLNPYLNWRSDAAAAMEFYHSVFGGELTVSRFRDFGMPVDESELDLVMHSQLTTPSGFTLMGADTPKHMELTQGADISVSLSGGPEDSAELHGYWDALSDGANVVEPLTAAPWGDEFGMLTDRYGIKWLVNIGGAPAA